MSILDLEFRYYSNLLAVLTATPAPSWTFLQWLGDAHGTNPTQDVTMTRDKEPQAMFGTPLTAAVVGAGSVLMSPISGWYPYGSQVRLTAVPEFGSYLAFWANAAAGQTTNPLTFTVTNAQPTVTAVFTAVGTPQNYALTVIPDGYGQVQLSPSGNRFPKNTNVTLLAVPAPNQDFIAWSGAATGTDNPLVITMTTNKVITATFTRRPALQAGTKRDQYREDGLRLTLTGDFGALYQVQSSPDFTHWTALATVTNIFGTLQFTHGPATNLPAQYYRATLLQP